MGKRRSGKKPLPIIEVEVTPRKARKCENMSLCTRASVLQIRISSESGSLERDGSRRVEVRRVRYKYEKDMSWERETHSHTPRKTALVKIANREWEDMTARPFTSSNFWVLRLPAHAHTQVSHPRQPFTPLELPLQPPSGPIIIILVFDRVKFCFVLLFYETVYIEVVQFNPTFRNWVLQKKIFLAHRFPYVIFECETLSRNLEEENTRYFENYIGHRSGVTFCGTDEWLGDDTLTRLWPASHNLWNYIPF